MEHDALARRPAVARVSDRIASFAGSGTFVLLHVVWFATWVLWNSGWFGLHRFDPYPFTFLTFIVSLEAIFLSTFVLISQNRMSQQSELRSHLDLQINLLAEQESTKTLRILLRVCERLGIDTDDEEMRQLMRETQPSQIVSDMTKHLPGEDS